MNESFRLVLIPSNMWAKIEDMSSFQCYQPWKLCTSFYKIINHTAGIDIPFHWIIQLRNMSWHIMAQFIFQGIHKFDTEFFIEQCQCLHIRISFVQFKKKKNQFQGRNRHFKQLNNWTTEPSSSDKIILNRIERFHTLVCICMEIFGYMCGHF